MLLLYHLKNLIIQLQLVPVNFQNCNLTVFNLFCEMKTSIFYQKHSGAYVTQEQWTFTERSEAFHILFFLKFQRFMTRQSCVSGRIATGRKCLKARRKVI